MFVQFDFQKALKIALAFMKEACSTNPILRALHLQGPKSNLYVHFPLENKKLTGVSFLK